MAGNQEDKARQLVAGLVQRLGYDLVGLQVSRRKVEVFVDKHEGGISVGECTAVSREVSDVLDTENLFNGTYTLEVSSPGARRPLEKPEDFRRIMKKKLSVNTSEPVNEKNVFTGILTNAGTDSITLACGAEEVVLPYHAIARARVHYEP